VYYWREELRTPLRWPQVDDKHTKFHNDWLTYSGNIKVTTPNNLRRCSVGIPDGMELQNMLLRWLQLARYILVS
jgi:hypothetical protein